MADKVDSKAFVERILGPGYTIPTIAVYDRVRDIEWDLLPERFVIKCAHDSGGVIVCPDKSKLDRRKAEKFLRCHQRKAFWHHRREWVYKNVTYRILVEQFYENTSDPDAGLVDYKFMCFDGRVENVMLCIDRMKHDVKYYFFDDDWSLLRINRFGEAAPEGFSLPRPDNLREMFDIAAKLSAGLPFVRVDLYNVGGRILFGEMTFYPKSGLDLDLLPETDADLGRKLNLPRKRG